MRSALAIVLLLLSAVCASAQTNVIISTDIAMGLNGGWRPGFSDSDDAWTLALAWKSLDVRAIAVTFGNNYADPEMTVLKGLLSAAGQKTPYDRGAVVKLSDPQVTLGATALNDSCRNAGVDRMIAELQRGPLTIVAIGPLTDIACVALNSPAATKNIREVVAIMGRDPGEEFSITDPWTGKPHKGLTDFNYVMDPRSASVVLQSQIPLTFMTFDLTKSTLVTQKQVAALGTTPLAKLISTNTLPWIAQWESIFGESGFHPWDANAAWYLARPEAYACKPAAARVVNCGTAPYYKDANNPCAGHGPDQPSSMDKEASQLWLSSVVGDAPRAKACMAWANEGEKQRFMDALIAAVR
ncbi:MAG: nucleoside hydrolase [Acidobacteriota bacterium]